MRWIAILHNKVGCSLASTSGIHRHGLDRIRGIEEEMATWMQEHEYESVEQLKGSLSRKNCPNPAAFERAQYMRTVDAQKPAFSLNHQL